MSVVEKVKSLIGVDAAQPNTYRCESCDSTFESNMEPDSVWLSCPDCDSDEITRTQAE